MDIKTHVPIIFIIPFLIFIVLPNVVCAQEIYDLNQHLTQPEFSSFTEYDKPQVDAQGNLNISIPLGVVEGRGNLDFPITLTYQSGIKVFQPSSWVGLGWNFSPGSISRTPSIGPYDNIDGATGVDVFNSQSINKSPDRFHITIPGRGSAEMIQVSEPNYTSNTIPEYSTGDFLTLEHKAWKIEYQKDIVTVDGIKTGVRTTDHSGVYDGKNEKEDFSKFLITVEDGTKYLFGAPTLAYVDVHYVDVYDSHRFIKQDYVSTWRLIAIFDADYQGDTWSVPESTDNGGWIKLTYSAPYTDSGYTNRLGHNTNYDYEFRQTRYLSSIDTPTNTATFTTANRFESILKPWEKDTQSGSHTNKTQKQLTAINFSNGRSVEFIQDNSFNPMKDSETNKGRLKLKEINFKGNSGGSVPGYMFDYVDNPTIDWISGLYYHELIACVDDFGFINESELGFLGNNYSQPCPNNLSSNSESGADSWSLSDIEYPTGLIDEIEYETRSISGDKEVQIHRHDPSISKPLPYIYKPLFEADQNDTIYIGGPRVKKITRDGNLKPTGDKKKRYEYSYEDGIEFSGVPEGYLRRKANNTGSVSIFSGLYSEASIYYGRIEIVSYEYDPLLLVNNIHRVRNDYYLGSTPNIISRTFSMNCIDPYSQGTGSGFESCNQFYAWSDFQTKNWGQLIGSYHLSGGAETYEKSYNTGRLYPHSGSSDPGRTNHLFTVQTSSTQTATLELHQYAERITFESNIDGEVYSRKSFIYDNETNLVTHQKLTQSVHQSDNQHRVTHYTHAHAKYPEMKERNKLSQIARVDRGLEQGSTVEWFSSDVTTWRIGNDLPPYSWKPWKIFSWKADSPASSPVNFGEWTSGSTPSNWLLNEEMKYYDDHGNIFTREFPNSSRINYTYDLNGSKVSSVEWRESNASNSLKLEVNLWYDSQTHQVTQLQDQYGVNQFFTYDQHMRLTEVRNHYNHLVKSYAYDYNLSFGDYNLNRITETTYTDPTDQNINISSFRYYDGLARIRQAVTEGKNDYVVEHYDYNDMGFLEKEWRPYLDESTNNGNFVSPNDARSRATQYYRDKLNLSFDPNPFSRNEYYSIAAPRIHQQYPAWTDQEVNNTYESGQDFDNNITSINGETVRFTRTIDESGNNQTTYINQFGQTVRQVVAQNTSDEMVTDFEYDAAGHLVKSISPRGLETIYEYNTLGQLTSRDLPDQDGEEKYKYDDLGNQRYTQSPNHQSNLASYDLSFSSGAYSGPVSETITATGIGDLSYSITVFDLFYGGYTVQIKDQDDTIIHQHFFWSDGSHSETIEVEPGTYTLEGFPHDSNEPIYGVWGDYSFLPYHEYTYTKYDNLGRPIETGEYSGPVSFSQANPNDNQFPTSDNQPNIKYCYDGNHSNCAAGYTFSAPNNPIGQLTKVQYRDVSNPGSSNWGYNLFSYNDLGLVEWKITHPYGLVDPMKIDYHYDELGRLSRRDFNDLASAQTLFVTWQDYDELGRLEKVFTGTNTSTSNRSLVATYSYNASGQVTQVEYNNPFVLTRYNIRGWIDQRTGYNTSQNPYVQSLFNMELEYTPNGNISKQTWNNSVIDDGNFVSYSYSYDAANRLKGANFSGAAYPNNAYNLSNINYDKNGNLTSYWRYDDQGSFGPGQTGYMDLFIENNSNRIDYLREGINYASFNVSYNANGNMTQNQLNGLQAAQYDWRNLPVVFNAGGNEIKHSHDADGMRVRKRTLGTDVHYIRGAMGETVAVFEDNTPAFYNILAGDEIIGQFDGQDRRYHIKDHLGSVRMTINDSQGIDGYQDYYPFGKINLSDSRRMPGRSYTSGNLYDNYKFTGHERDDEFDMTLDYMQARMYDPVIGRFLNVDPLASDFPGWSPYNYAMNNPLLLIDPDGKSPVCGEETHCDDTYRKGAIVENNQGSWEYLGDNEWKTLHSADGNFSVTGLLKTFVKDGPQYLDSVHDAAFQMTVFLGSGLLVASQTPFPHDDLGLGALTSLSAGITQGSDIAATTLSGVDAFVFGGNRNDFNFRAYRSALRLGVILGPGSLYRAQLKNTLLGQHYQNALNRTATTTTSKVTVQPLKKR